MSADTETRAGGQSSFCAAVVRFLVKMAFFSTMLALGLAVAYWIPDPPSFDAMMAAPHKLTVDLVIFTVAVSGLVMLWGGLIGLGLTVFTAGRKPRWD